jgi:release factor glutamine methyltransferase
VLDWEPSLALFVPNDNPLLFYRTIAEKAKTMLAHGGELYFEINREHGTDTCTMLTELGYTNIRLHKDFAGNDRMVSAKL